MNTTERFKGASWFGYRRNTNVIIGGAGGIGSNLAYLLAKSDIGITVIDYDAVEEHNIGGQFYSISDIGKPKVFALYDNLYKMTYRSYIGTIPDNLGNSNITQKMIDGLPYHRFPILVCAFDNMEARKQMFNEFNHLINKEENASILNKILFVDGRLSAEYFKYFVFNGSEKDKIKDYMENHLKNDSEYGKENCTFSQTVDVAMMLTSKMSVAIKNHITNNISTAGGVKQIPYMEEYSASVGRTSFNLTV